MMLFPGADGKVKAPLYKVWELVAFHGRGPCAQWAQSNIRDLNTHLGTRNESILAHGFKPIEESKWREMQTWIEDRLLPPFFEQATRTGIRTWSDQLPRVCGSVCRL
ncbi:MAG: hypothetical protein EOM25_12565 [Deltaproteobacteria bacterium]|nr:hypothetical protein [Deltaproteobacteria bacterium]